MYYAVASAGLDGGAQITASHNPKQYNGCKLVKAEAFPLSGESGIKEWTIGSQADREVQFQDSGVSALHAKIVNEGERWKVLDQMSANGTFVNGKRSNVSYLTAGDRVRFGPVECIFLTARAAAPPRRSGSSSSGAAAESKSKTLLIAGIAFAVTIVVLFLVYRFVL